MASLISSGPLSQTSRNSLHSVLCPLFQCFDWQDREQ